MKSPARDGDRLLPDTCTGTSGGESAPAGTSVGTGPAFTTSVETGSVLVAAAVCVLMVVTVGEPPDSSADTIRAWRTSGVRVSAAPAC